MSDRSKFNPAFASDENTDESSQRQRVDVNDLIVRFSKNLRHLAAEDIALVFQHSGASLEVHAGSVIIEKILAELVSRFADAISTNGNVYIRTEEVRITTNVLPQFPQARAGRFVCISVKGKGTGISAETSPDVIQGFLRIREFGQDLKFEAVCRLAKQHDGWIDMENSDGGTVFKIFLPLISELYFRNSGQWSISSAVPGHETVLLVEDENAVRDLAAAILKRHGYHVIETRSAADALAMLRESCVKVDLLLTDLDLPDGISGQKLSGELQQLYPQLRTVFTTDYSSAVAEQGAISTLNSSFLPKPYLPNDLAMAVRRRLDLPVLNSRDSEILLAN